MASCKLKVASGKWQVGEPSDDTNFGSHANPGIGSHFGQTKFLAIHSASPKIKRLKSGLVAHLYGRKQGKSEPNDSTNFGSHALPTLIRISVKQNS